MFGVLTAATLLSLVAVAMPASAASEDVTNGDFEQGPTAPTTTLVGWTAMNQLIDLGTTAIAGCQTVDTADYSRLPLYNFYRGITWTGSPIANGAGIALVPGTTDEVWISAAGAIVAANTPNSVPIYYGTGYSSSPNGSQLYWYDTNNSRGRVVTYDRTAERLFQNMLGVEARAAQTSATAMLDALASMFGGVYTPGSDPLIRQDNVPAMTEASYWRPTPQEFRTEILTDVVNPDYDPVNDPSEPQYSLSFDSRALSMTSEMKADPDVDTVTIGTETYLTGGYVAHGPAVYSDPFETTRPMTLTLDWRATAERDYYAVLGYVLNTDTCEQIEVIDSAGGDTGGWTASAVTIPNPGNYRFVFVSGSYDFTWGTGAGANFYIDNVRVVPVTPAVAVTPDFVVGDPAANAPFTATGSNLRSNSPWTVTLGPAGTVLGSGTTTVAGTFSASLTLPALMPPGQYTLTVTGTASDGTITVQTLNISVAADGTIAAFAVAPSPTAALAAAGIEIHPSTLAAIAGLLALGVALVLAGRRRIGFRRQE